MQNPAVHADMTHSVMENFSEKRPDADIPTGTTSWYWALLTVLNVLDGLGKTGGPEWRESSPTWKCTSNHNDCLYASVHTQIHKSEKSHGLKLSMYVNALLDHYSWYPLQQKSAVLYDTH